MSFAVEKPEQVVRKCQRALSSILTYRVGFNPPSGVPGENKIWVLNGVYQATAETGNQTLSVVPLLETNRHNYWLSVTIEFEFVAGKYLFRNVSVNVFEGEALDELKNPLLRAEWAREQENERAAHAQPHWHVYGTPSRTTTRSAATFGDQQVEQFGVLAERELETEPFVARGWLGGERFHFAMASRWHTDGVNAHKEEMSEAYLIDWLKGCLLYSAAQLEYIDR